ncbi:hypothetical protein A0H81_12382 [Grifola frondosa]|uniref:Uncharacterized protein n=1 Tax=Grifola frondosa TaxID=5627 RepID=A0A1C7LSJ4_GRIFR|nr:hypothetical protein A0H81_12382 [Grifola frondosa]
MSYTSPFLPPNKRQRRTATSVLAGDFDTRLGRDVLTSLLNGVSTTKLAEQEAEERRTRKKERKERERERRRAKAAVKAAEKALPPVASTSSAASALNVASKHVTPVPRASTSSFWQARPTIHIATAYRNVSVTPPPMPSPSPTTPGPSISSTTSATSSKRPFTPDDDEDITDRNRSVTPAPKPRKKRPAARKGWKGWVEGSPPPSEKLINLDTVTVGLGLNG